MKVISGEFRPKIVKTVHWAYIDIKLTAVLPINNDKKTIKYL